MRTVTYVPGLIVNCEGRVAGGGVFCAGSGAGPLPSPMCFHPPLSLVCGGGGGACCGSCDGSCASAIPEKHKTLSANRYRIESRCSLFIVTSTATIVHLFHHLQLSEN